MADENFVLTLVGRLDEKETKQNVQRALDNISGSVGLNGNRGANVKVFDKAELEAQGRTYLESAQGIRDKLLDMFDPDRSKGLEVKFDKLFDENGLVKFKANITEAGQLIKTLNFDRAKFTDDTEGFILKSTTERDIQEIHSINTAVEELQKNLVNVNGVNGWGSMKSAYATIEQFKQDYQQSVLGKNGDPTINYTFNKNNEISGFTAQIKDADGQLQKLHFTLQQIKNDDGQVIDSMFRYTGGSINANAFEQTTKQLESQRMNLERYKITLNEINQLSLNPDSKMFVGESDKLKDVVDKYNDIKSIMGQMVADNQSGKIVPTEQYNDFLIKLRELQSELKLLRKESGNNIDRDESAATLARNIDIARSKIDLLIERWKQAGILTGDFKIKVDDLRASLENVKSNQELDAFNDKLKALTNNAQQLMVQLRGMGRDEQFSQRLRILSQQVEAFANANTKAAQTYTVQFNNLRDGIANATNVNDLRRLQNEFRSLKIAVQDAGLAGKTFGERMKETFGRVLRFTGITSLFMTLSRGFRQLLTNVKDLDTAMVNLRKVTDESEATYSDVFKNATESAKELHTEITNIIEATAEYAKLGYNINEAQELAKAAVIYQNVGEISSAEEASKSIISTMKAYGIEAENAMEIVDKFNKVGNEFAITSQGIGDSLQRSASSLATARNSLEESIGLIVGANTVVQDTNKVGVALKTLSLRIMSTKADLEEMGEDAEYAAETISDYRNQVLGLTSKTTAPVDLYDINGEYKNTTQILRELSAVWDQLTVNEQAAIEKLLAGARQANIFASIMTNFDVVEDAIVAASNATGSAMKEQEAWQDSIVAKQQKMASIFQSISSNILNSDDYKGVLDFFIQLSEAIDKVTASGNGLKTLIPVISGIIGGAGGGFVNFQNFGKVNNLVELYNYNVNQGAEATRNFINQIAVSNPTFARYVTDLKGAQATTQGFRAAQIKATASTVALNAATVALNTVLNAGIGLAISLIVSAISKWVNANNELTQSLKDSSQELENNTTDLQSYTQQIDKIIDSEESEYDKINSLNEIKDELNKKYGLEIDTIRDLTTARKELNDALDDEIKKERERYLGNADNRKAYENAKKQLNDMNIITGWQGIKNSFAGNNSSIGEFAINVGKTEKDTISKDIKDLFDSAGVEWNKDKYQIKLGIDPNSYKDEIEYFNKLEKIYFEFVDIRSTRVGALTKDEETLFNLVSQQYTKLEEKNKDAIENVQKYAKSSAEQIISLFEQGSLTDSEYFDKLSQYANGDLYVIEQLKELIFVTHEAEDATEELVSPLAEVLGNLQLIANATSDMTVAINNANDSFEKLEKTFQTNNDPDKYFSASEIIELLDLYPQLNDAILESQYGYKIEQEALENLRQTKLNEQKTALQAQLEETNTLMQATKQKLEAYKDEVAGIQSVADAKTQLAQLEMRLEAARALDTTNPYKVSVSYLEGQKEAVQEYIDASEKAKKYEEQIKKLQTQINVLGQVHDSAKDKTQDHTKALQEQKDAIKDLADAMNDAKKDIEDLVDLTIEMLKKNKEQEKSALKESLEGYKKLIERRKQLIDLEKDYTIKVLSVIIGNDSNVFS